MGTIPHLVSFPWEQKPLAPGGRGQVKTHAAEWKDKKQTL